MLRLATLIVILISVACAPTPSRGSSVAPRECLAGPLADTLTLSREAFFREVLFATPTVRTPRFDDYTPGSYHVDKLDVAAGLPAEAARCGLRLRALLTVGPTGPLWAYHVVPFIEDGESVRVNSLVMPHARITGKGSGQITDNELSRLVATLTRSPLVRSGLPVFPDSVESPLSRDFSYDLLLVVFDRGQSPRYWYASFRQAQPENPDRSAGEVDEVLDAINEVLGRTSSTYDVRGARGGAPHP